MKKTYYINQVIEKYGSGLTLRECAKLFGVTPQAIHYTIKKYAGRKMRQPHSVPAHRITKTYVRTVGENLGKKYKKRRSQI